MVKLDFDEVDPYIILVRIADDKTFFVQAVHPDTKTLSLESIDDECLQDTVDNYKLPILTVDKYIAIKEWS